MSLESIGMAALSAQISGAQSLSVRCKESSTTRNLDSLALQWAPETALKMPKWRVEGRGLSHPVVLSLLTRF